MKPYNLVLSGLGGQGVMTISHVLARAASREGVSAKLFEGTGITQRGGGVFSFVRFGEVYSPKIAEGEAHGIVCLEISEVVRVINYLESRGKIWINTARVQGYYTKLRPKLYPREQEIEALVLLKTPYLCKIPADRLAREAGSPQAVNMVMLGAFVRGEVLLRKESVIQAIEETNRRFAAANVAAFEKGYDFVTEEKTAG